MVLKARPAPAAGLLRTVPEPGALPHVAYALALDPSQKFGSMEEQIVFLAERFRAEGSLFAPVFICDPNANAAEFHERGIDAHCLDLRRFSVHSLRALRRLVSSRQIDILHWNFVPPLANPYVWWMSIMNPGVRHWFTDHNSRLFPAPPPPTGLGKVIKRFLLKRYGRVICVSRYVEECLAEQHVWSNVVSQPHFINTDRFCPDATERRHKRAAMNVEDQFVLLTVGQLIPEKGMEVAIRALAALPDRVILWIAGKGPERQKLKATIEDLNLQGRVQLLGQQRHVEPFLQAADCFVCPSLWGEAAGLVNIEAQACGTPVIASRIGGIPEYVADGQTGLLFRPGDADALAGCVRRLSDDHERCRQFAMAARAHAVEHFSQGACLDDWLESYRHWRN